MPNRLAGESSPYLLQHAGNPVDWWPWCDEAFEEARRRDVPVFLSIGYSTCYWCHVMERESFENPRIAESLNPRFVCIKLDREERPDVDEAYMAATVSMTGHGGWPMSVFLEPERRRPFYCGTYFPPEAHPRLGRPGFVQVLDAMHEAWTTRRNDVIEQAAEVARAVAETFDAPAATGDLSSATVSDAVSMLLRAFDQVHGGFGKAPKFPQPEYIEFLLDVRAVADEATADAVDHAVKRTLAAMMSGGLFDQVGGGFHRYSVDESWTVPHFEKMLYDNAQLAAVYARAARHYGEPAFARAAHRTLGYILREMTAPDGGFYSAQDAEVDHREGLNYLWTPDQIRDALGPENADDADLAIAVYGLADGPNFRDPHHPEAPPLNIPRLTDLPERTAAGFNLLPSTLLDRLDRINAALLAARDRRPQPARDDKVIASWNGLAISAFARAAADLDEPRYLDAAVRAAAWIEREMIVDGRLCRTRRGDRTTPHAVLEDFACVMRGLIDTHRAASDLGRDDASALPAAVRLLGVVRREYLEEDGRLFDAPRGASDLFVRTRSTHDGAMPCGLSVMLRNLLDLAEITADPDYAEEAVRCLSAASGRTADNPTGAVGSVRALLRLLLHGRSLPRSDGGSAPAPPAMHEPDPVQVLAADERIVVSPESPATLSLVIRIADGWHIAAAEPGPAPGPHTPFRIGLVSGGGLAVYADYPPGEVFSAPDGTSVRVYSGEVEVRVVVEQTGEITGRPLLGVTFQACNNTRCLAPATLELDIAIDEA